RCVARRRGDRQPDRRVAGRADVPGEAAVPGARRGGVAVLRALSLTARHPDVVTPSAGAALLGPAEVRALASSLGLSPSKQRGQNFVVDPNTVRRIVRAADVGADDVVLEVGPGLGSLTLALLPAVASVVAVEVDTRLATRLPTTVADRAPAYAD